MDLTQLKNQILNIINQSETSIDGVYYVLKDLTNEIGQTYDQYLLTRYQQEKYEKENTKEEENQEEKGEQE